MCVIYIYLCISRFPATDLRPIHNSDRVPWWKRNVLKDFLTANFTDVKIAFNNSSHYEISADKIDLFYNVRRNSMLHQTDSHV